MLPSSTVTTTDAAGSLRGRRGRQERRCAGASNARTLVTFDPVAGWRAISAKVDPASNRNQPLFAVRVDVRAKVTFATDAAGSVLGTRRAACGMERIFRWLARARHLVANDGTHVGFGKRLHAAHGSAASRAIAEA